MIFKKKKLSTHELVVLNKFHNIIGILFINGLLISGLVDFLQLSLVLCMTTYDQYRGGLLFLTYHPPSLKALKINRSLVRST